MRKISLLAATAGIDVHIIARRHAKPELTSIGDKTKDAEQRPDERVGDS